MNVYDQLLTALKNKISIKEDMCVFATIESNGATWLKLRDNLLMLGEILEEDEHEKTYLSRMGSGFLKKNDAVIISKNTGNKIYIVCYAAEGLINQNCALDSVKRLALLFSGSRLIIDKAPYRKKIKPLPVIIAIAMLALAVFCSIYCIVFSNRTKAYNQALEIYNATAEKYNEKAPLAAVDNIEGLYDELPLIDEVGESFGDNVRSIFSGNSVSKINNDIKTLIRLTENAKDSLAILDKIIAPNINDIADKLKKLDEMTALDIVDINNDPNQMLGKEGGYTGCIYFTLSSVPSDQVDGDTALEKGTDGGGCIEVYPTLEDAENRCEYLSQYDSTILYSGSYAIVGTMVIRVSYLLDVNKQLDVTEDITRLILD